MAHSKIAVLHTAQWTEVGRARFSRKSWPEVIVWQDRVFTKATTGKTHESYVETTVLHATKVIPRAKYGKEKL